MRGRGGVGAEECTLEARLAMDPRGGGRVATRRDTAAGAQLSATRGGARSFMIAGAGC